MWYGGIVLCNTVLASCGVSEVYQSGEVRGFETHAECFDALSVGMNIMVKKNGLEKELFRSHYLMTAGCLERDADWEYDPSEFIEFAPPTRDHKKEVDA